jgi:hypothetical protein
MSRPGIELGPPRWESSTLEKNHSNSLLNCYSEPQHTLLKIQLFNVASCAKLRLSNEVLRLTLSLFHAGVNHSTV